MELSNQIKKYRKEQNMSQETLAEKIYVTRQTISNWENDKNYPDINSLLRLSDVFGVSVDTLLKGDVEVIQNIIKDEDKKLFDKMARVYTFLLLLMVISPIPLAKFLGFWGIGIWAVIATISLIYALKVEKKKKELDISTYREIAAFMEGKNLDEIEKAREEGKRPYQRFLMILTGALVALLVCSFIMFILK